MMKQDASNINASINCENNQQKQPLKNYPFLIQSSHDQTQILNTLIIPLTQQNYQSSSINFQSIQNLKLTLKDKNNHTIEIQKTINHFITQNDQLKNNKISWENIIEHINNQNHVMFENKIKQLQKQHQITLQNKIKQLQNQHQNNISSKVRQLQNQLNKTIQKHQQKIKALKIKNQKLLAENDAKNQRQKKQLKFQILTLQLDLQQKVQHFDDLNKKYKKQTTTLKQQIQKLKSVSQYESEIHILQLKITQIQQVLMSKQIAIQNLNNKINELKTVIQKQKEDSNKLIEQMTELKKENESLEKQLSRLSDERNKFESQNNNLRDKLNYERNSHNQEFTKMKKEHALQIKNTKLEGARAAQEIRRQIKSIEYAERLSQVPNNNKSVQNQSMMRRQIEKMQQKLQRLTSQKGFCEHQNMKLKQQLAQLKQSLEQKSQKVKMFMLQTMQGFTDLMN